MTADPAAEVARLEALLAERRAELTALQDGLREFRGRYTQIIGGRLSELAEIEREIEEAEARLLGVEADEDAEEEATAGDDDDGGPGEGLPVRAALRKLFWSVAKVFHPDRAADEGEARRRHSIMAEASRAYREGDVESLHTLLGDEGLRSYCATPPPDEAEALSDRLLRLEMELRTVEFGIRRVTQDSLYQLKLRVEEEAVQGRDALADQAASLDRKITKARRRLAHLA